MRKLTALTTLLVVAALPNISIAGDKEKKDSPVSVTKALKIGVLDWQLLVAKSPQAEQAGARAPITELQAHRAEPHARYRCIHPLGQDRLRARQCRPQAA